MNGKDPGWKPALRLYAGGLFPWRLKKLRDPRVAPAALTVMRIVWLALVQASLLFLLVLALGERTWDGEPGPFMWLVPSAGILGLVGILALRRRPLDASSRKKLRESFQLQFYMGFVLTELALLLGFVGAIVQDAVWLYAFALPFHLAGMLLSGPTRTNIERHDQQLREFGSALRLSEVLTAPATETESENGG